MAVTTIAAAGGPRRTISLEMDAQRRLGMIGGIGLALVALAALLTACASPPAVGRDAAVEIAREAFIGKDATSSIANVQVLSVELTTDAGRPAWKINLSGSVTPSGGTQGYVSAAWMFVYGDTGEVRIFAQG